MHQRLVCKLPTNITISCSRHLAEAVDYAIHDVNNVQFLAKMIEVILSAKYLLFCSTIEKCYIQHIGWPDGE